MKTLTARAFSGFLTLALALALFIFLPAGTFRYGRGWLFLLVFLACSLAVTLYFLKRDPKLVESRLKAGPAAEQEKSQKVIQALNSLFFSAALVVSGLDHRFGWSPLPLSAAFAGEGMVLAGYAAVFLALKENTYAASVVKVRPKQKVVATGPYALVRHPMYAGAFVMLLGTPLALGSVWGLVPVCLLCAAIVVRLLEEEKFLMRKLPGYTAYRRKTPYRLVPGLW